MHKEKMIEKLVGYHGDVQFITIDKIPKNLKPRKKDLPKGFVMAWGEVTGHKHLLYDQEGLEVMEDDEGTIYLHITEDQTIIHEEHVETNIPLDEIREKAPEMERIMIDFPQEYDYAEEIARQVAD
tara:strand:+ start:75 stop:452 length:378 start_codon:yes stop_codon:yes gene_type:complete